MLEIRNVTKIYRSKTGESVKALDNISISFPESGMVFLLGKSGSGKSTLLNVIGGLDSCDSGEFIIKGKSSKDFKGSDFDAYRNTFIGFIFQEYNVLDDFSVGANIALALELQGKKATNDRINAILHEVDLSNYAKRKPNELSGGQKQRVAIARALVKEPEIIMADEPTGALDSGTGKQIFDTLKKLSREKLVIVVSHDRDFAEKYADRIIELSDGSVVSDVTKHERPGEHISEGIDRISHNLFKINRGYRLTEHDIDIINRYIEENDCDVIISGDVRVNQELKSAAGITESGGTTVFEETDAEKDIKIKQYDGKKTGFIHSRLPIKNALRIGSSGLKHKKIRLAMTIILSTIAFALFGLSDTMAAYNRIRSATDSLIDSDVKFASFSLNVANYYMNGDKVENKYFEPDTMNDEDIKKLSEMTSLDFIPVFTGSTDRWSSGFSIASNYSAFSSNQVYNGKLSGVISADEKTLDSAGLRLVAGRLPSTQGEIVISELTYRSFTEFGFKNSEHNEEIRADKIKSYNDIIGKHISLTSSSTGEDETYKIVGILDTHFDYERYENFLPSDTPIEGNLADMVLQSELETDLKYGFHALGVMHPGDIDALIKKIPLRYEEYGEYMYGYDSEVFLSISKSDTEGDFINYFNYIGTDTLIPKLDIFWIGDAKTSLAENEVILPMQILNYFIPENVNISDLSGAELEEYLSDIRIERVIRSFELGTDNVDKTYSIKIVGFAEDSPSDNVVSLVICNNIYNDYKDWYQSQLDENEVIADPYKWVQAEHESGIWSFAISPISSDSSLVEKLVNINYDESGDIQFCMNSSIMSTLDSFNEFIEIGAKIFLYIGIGFAIFSAFLLMNFIATSISYKKREIGILRAVGARSSDVFKIFFSEALIIALINFLLSAVTVILATIGINNLMRNEGIRITLLSFGIRQLALMLLISVAVALVSSFLPVNRIARKKPVDAIKDK